MLKRPTSCGPMSTSRRNAREFLGRIRESEKRSAERAYQDSRLPDGVGVRPFAILLLEGFFIEDVHRLEERLTQLFGSESTSPDWRDRLRESMRGVAGLLSVHVGCITRSPSRGVLGDSVCVESLPADVDIIDVTVHKTLGSFYALSLEVLLADAAAESFLKVCDMRYPSDVQRVTRPGGRRVLRTDAPERLMRQAVACHVGAIRSSIESAVLGECQGVFLARAKPGRPTLPAIEVYSMTGQIFSRETYLDWSSANNRWLSARDLQWVHGAPFVDSGVAYLSNLWLHTSPSVADKILFCWETFRDSDYAWKCMDGDLDKVLAGLRELLTAAARPVAIKALLAAANEDLTDQRQLALEFGRTRHRLPLRQLASSGLTVLRAHARLDRSRTEFMANRSLLESSMHLLSRLRLTTPSGDTPEGSLQARMLGAIERDLVLICEHLAQSKAARSDLLQLLGTEAAYGLQRRILWLTAAMLLVGIVSLLGLADSDAARGMVRWLASLLTSVGGWLARARAPGA